MNFFLPKLSFINCTTRQRKPVVVAALGRCFTERTMELTEAPPSSLQIIQSKKNFCWLQKCLNRTPQSASPVVKVAQSRAASPPTYRAVKVRVKSIVAGRENRESKFPFKVKKKERKDPEKIFLSNFYRKRKNNPQCHPPTRVIWEIENIPNWLRNSRRTVWRRWKRSKHCRMGKEKSKYFR